MAERTLKSLVLIRAKHLAESVTTPMLIIDANGTIVFYNEAAGALFDVQFTDVGQLTANDWQTRFNVRDRHDQSFPLDAMPGWIKLQKERVDIGHVRLTTLAGEDKFLAACAFPLFTSQQQFDGGLVLFWVEDENQEAAS
jgi:PAS domain-containing protein